MANRCYFAKAEVEDRRNDGISRVGGGCNGCARRLFASAACDRRRGKNLAGV